MITQLLARQKHLRNQLNHVTAKLYDARCDALMTNEGIRLGVMVIDDCDHKYKITYVEFWDNGRYSLRGLRVRKSGHLSKRTFNIYSSVVLV